MSHSREEAVSLLLVSSVVELIVVVIVSVLWSLFMGKYKDCRTSEVYGMTQLSQTGLFKTGHKSRIPPTVRGVSFILTIWPWKWTFKQ